MIPFLINTIILIGAYIPVLRAEVAYCYEYAMEVQPAACFDLIRHLPTVPEAKRIYNWGATSSSNDQVPGKALPYIISQNIFCMIELDCPFSEPEPEALRVMDYYDRLYQLYHECAVGGNRQGGWIAIGETGAVEIMLSVYTPLGSETMIEIDGNGRRFDNETVVDE
ncbi:MAG: hypothetical protein Q9163_003675 [Psora crenata]